MTTAHETSAKKAIASLEEDNRRLKKTIDTGYFDGGYVQNCKNTIESNLLQIEALKAEFLAKA